MNNEEFNESEQKIYDFLLESNASIEEVLDVIIKSNCIVGVGFYSLLSQIEKHINMRASK
mgnify:CR=1 FL=1